MTRIIGGLARGRRLTVPPRGTRPTSDRVRESLFSSVESRLLADGTLWHEIDVLDLYAGSGALGLEALSRGARSVTLVESDRAAARVLRANEAAMGLPGGQVVEAKVGALARSGVRTCAHLVLVDPPYDVPARRVASELAALEEAGLIAPDALVIVERPVRDPDPPLPPGWTPLGERRYGDTVLWYGRNCPQVQESAVDEGDEEGD